MGRAGQIATAVAKGLDGIKFVAPITREGPGWRADIDLPLGVTPGDVADRRARLASALRRPLGCVWPDADPNEHEGRLVLWVGDRDLSKTGIVKWTLAGARRHDAFAGIPFGIDPRGRAQRVPLIQHNILIGSQPGQGKTASVRVLACGAALDPTTELWLHENKGTGDLDALEPVSHRFVSGIDARGSPRPSEDRQESPRMPYPERAALLAAAMETAARGWPVFPLRPGDKPPALHGERRCPGTGDCAGGHRKFEQRATTNPERIERCWTAGAFNVGIATGPARPRQRNA